MSWNMRHVGQARVDIDLPEIVGKQRPRVVRQGNIIRTYTPAKTAHFEDLIRYTWLQEVGDTWQDFSGVVHIGVISKRELSRSNPKFWQGRADTQKPDIDNILKSVCDALNGIAYADDAQITQAAITKAPRSKHGAGCFF